MEEYREQLDAYVQELGFVPMGDDLWQRETEYSNLILSLVTVGDTLHVRLSNGNDAEGIPYCRYAVTKPLYLFFGVLKKAVERAIDLQVGDKSPDDIIFEYATFGPDKSLSGQLEKRQTHVDDPRQAKPL